MIPKEIMKRGGILSRLARYKEESPYKPETVYHHTAIAIFANASTAIVHQITGATVSFFL